MTGRAAQPSALALLLAATGILVAWRPTLAFGWACLIAATAVAIAAGHRFWRWLTLLAVGGPLVLGYGFANVGLTGPVPVPLTNAILALLVIWVLLQSGLALPRRPLPFLLAGLLLLDATIRLGIDLTVWGVDALRDYTLPLELACSLLIGYWAIRNWGVGAVVAGLDKLFAVAAAYLLLYPLREPLAAVSPQVGLQHPVPLFGSYAHAGTSALAGLLFAGLLVKSPSRRLVLSAGFLIVLALVQSRGIYLAAPLAILAVVVVPRRVPGLRRRILGPVAAAIVVATLLFALVPLTGRLGDPVSLSFVTAHLSTLAGAAGPGAGSLESRRQFASATLERVRETPYGWLWGVGLGRDLAGEFRVAGEIDVRKPHNDYLEVFARLGVVGLICFVSVLAVSLGRIVTTLRSPVEAPNARFLLWVLGTTAAFLCIAATQPLLAFPYGTVPLFFALGAGLAVAEQARLEVDRDRVTPPG